MEESEVYRWQTTPELHIEIEYVQYDKEGKVHTWFVNITKDGHTVRHPWDTFKDAEWFFNEHRLQYINTEGK